MLSNLKIAFPEKPDKELKKISKQFYHNLADTFVEIIKLISMSDKTFSKRFGRGGSEPNTVNFK